jgi:hypothetical protein
MYIELKAWGWVKLRFFNDIFMMNLPNFGLKELNWSLSEIRCCHNLMRFALGFRSTYIGLYLACHRFRLTNGDDYFWVNFDYFCSKYNFLSQLDSSDNWFELKIWLPKPNLTKLSMSKSFISTVNVSTYFKNAIKCGNACNL